MAGSTASTTGCCATLAGRLNRPTSSRRSRRKSQHRTRLGEGEARQPRQHRGRVAVSEVAEEVRSHVALGEEFLLAPEARLAGGKERFIHPGVVESRERSAVESEGARREDQVRALQAR